MTHRGEGQVEAVSDIEALSKIVRAFPLEAGENRTDLPFLTLYRFTERKMDMPKTENPYIYVVLDGSLWSYTPSGIMDYIPGQYFVSEIDTPTSGYVLTFSDRNDFLALALEFTLNDVISVVLDLDGNLAEKIADAQLDSSIQSVSNQNVLASVRRLVSLLKESISSVKFCFLFCAAPAAVNFCKAFSVSNSRGKYTKSTAGSRKTSVIPLPLRNWRRNEI